MQHAEKGYVQSDEAAKQAKRDLIKLAHSSTADFSLKQMRAKDIEAAIKKLPKVLDTLFSKELWTKEQLEELCDIRIAEGLLNYLNLYANVEAMQDGTYKVVQK